MSRNKPREFIIFFVLLTLWYFVLNWKFGPDKVTEQDLVRLLKNAGYEVQLSKPGTPVPAPVKQATIETNKPNAAALPKQDVKEPLKQQPLKQEPPKQAPVKQEPTKQEHAKKEPVKQEPPKQAPVKQAPAKQEPAKQDQLLLNKQNGAHPASFRKVIVVASTKNTSTDWIQSELPDWEAAVYVADDPTAPLHPEINKGTEANMYLKYLIDNYDNLPDVAVFVHGHRQAYHSDFAFRDTPGAVKRLKMNEVKKIGYQTLTCWQAPGCNVSEQSFWNYAKQFQWGTKIWQTAFNEEPPDVIICPKFAQFAVSKDAMRTRSKADYERIRKYILETKELDSVVGRYMEHMWHRVFGKPARFCQLRQDCLASFDMSDKSPAEVVLAVKAYENMGWDKAMT